MAGSEIRFPQQRSRACIQILEVPSRPPGTADPNRLQDAAVVTSVIRELSTSPVPSQGRPPITAPVTGRSVSVDWRPPQRAAPGTPVKSVGRRRSSCLPCTADDAGA